MARQTNRVVKAALIALAAGALVAVDNPARPIDHDVAIAVVSAAKLTAGATRLARDTLVRHA